MNSFKKVSLDSLSDIYDRILSKSVNPKKEWCNWRLVSVQVREMVDRSYLRKFGNPCKSLERFVDFPRLFASINVGATTQVSALVTTNVLSALHNAVHLSVISLNILSIGDEGAKSIANLLQKSKNLNEIYLGNNNIGDEGAIAIAKALQSNNSLVKLSLFNNQIGDKGAIAMADCLKRQTSLKYLSLSWNKIGDEGAKAIAESLRSNTSLAELWLSHNSISEKVKQEFKQDTTLKIVI